MMTAEKGVSVVLPLRVAAVAAGATAVLVGSPPLLAPRPVPTVLWVVLWGGATIMGAVSVRIWRIAGREADPRTAVGPVRVMVPLQKALAIVCGTGVACVSAYILFAPRLQRLSLPWVGAAVMAGAATVLWWHSKHFPKAADRAEGGEPGGGR